MRQTRRVEGMSEEQILAALLPSLPVSEAASVPTGDDCAVFAVPDGRVAVSTDMLVEGTHFRRDWSTGADVAHRAIMQNLADAAAMGARPFSVVISMQVPPSLPFTWLEDFGRGLAEACEPYAVGVDGGDLTSGPVLTIAVSVLGNLEGRAPLLRSSATVGESLIFAGTLGRAAAGLALLERGWKSTNSPLPDTATRLVEDFLRPKPPIATVLDAAREGVLGALMDVSDGLVRDGRRMATASNVWLDIESAALAPFLDDLMVLAPHLGMSNPLEWAFETVISGGEDHGFLATAPCPPQRAWGGCSLHLPAGFIRIGRVREAWKGGRLTIDGAEIEGMGGWDHFHASEPA